MSEVIKISGAVNGRMEKGNNASIHNRRPLMAPLAAVRSGYGMVCHIMAQNGPGGEGVSSRFGFTLS